MTTQLFLRFNNETPATPYLFGTGNNDAPIGVGPWGATSPWFNRELVTARGSGVQGISTPTVASNTTGIEMGESGIYPYAWVSAPIDQDVTISGTITFNLWMGENATANNAGAMCVIERISSTGAIISTIASSAKGTELPKTSSIAAQNWTVTATSTNMLKGDRIRVRVLMKNVGTMGTDAIGCQLNYSGTTAAASGDSYVQFTETFGFQTALPAWQHDSSGTNQGIGTAAATSKVAQSFTLPSAVSPGLIDIVMSKSGTPTDDMTLEIRTDNAGEPSSTVLATSNPVSASTITTSRAWIRFTFPSPASLSASTTYWLVAYRSGAASGANFVGWGRANSAVYANGNPSTQDSGTLVWTPGTQDFTFLLSDQNTILYPTTTSAGIDPGAATESEMWTSRGGANTSAVTSSVTGWTAPIQVTATAGGTALEWYSKPLTAFTLSGIVLVNYWGSKNNSLPKGISFRPELAITERDGTSPTVWGAISYPDEVANAITVYQIYIAGDDVAITDGQRLRLRFYIDDASTLAMVSAITGTISYAGPSFSVAYDTFLILPQAVTELPGAIPTLVMPQPYRAT